VPKRRPNIESAFGAVLRKHRRSAGLSQMKLAERSGVSTNFISFCERGIQHPTLNSLFLLADGLGVEPVDLIAEVQDLNPVPKI
jgi:transcriptional regulator with XRE-family HTH domain